MTAAVSAPVVPASVPMTCIAACRATCQLTGPVSPDIRSPSCRSIDTEVAATSQPAEPAEGRQRVVAGHRIRVVVVPVTGEAERWSCHDFTVAVKMEG